MPKFLLSISGLTGFPPVAIKMNFEVIFLPEANITVWASLICAHSLKTFTSEFLSSFL